MVKLGAIPSIIFLAAMAYLAIPSQSNIMFLFIDTITSGFCPDVTQICDIIPLLKTMVNIIGGIGFILTLLNIIGMIARGEFFRVKQQKQR